MTLFHLAISALMLYLFGNRALKIVRRNGSWKRVVGWAVVAVVAYAGFIVWVSGPGAKYVDQLSEGEFFTAFPGLALVVVLALCELGMRALDGPYRQLPEGVDAANTYRRQLYPWMAIAAAVVILMALARRHVPASWQENWFIATLVAGLFSCITLWFLHYKARRFDYGMTALKLNPWFHWVYTADDLKGFKGVKTGPEGEAWFGLDGLFFNGDFAPWTMFVYCLVRASVNNAPPPNLDFTFKSTSFGNATSLEVIHVPIPKNHAADVEIIQQKLRALCPNAEINLVA
jgi:hypothetical protein